MRGAKVILSLWAIAFSSSTTQPGWTQPVPAPVITADTPSQVGGLTVPSLWWAEEQFGGKLLATWSAYPATKNTPKRIELIVRWELWRPLGYIDRYAFVYHFGTVARDYGYNLQVLDQEKNPLANYTCNFSQANPRYVEGVRDSQGRRVPDYVPSKDIDIPCQIQLGPLTL